MISLRIIDAVRSGNAIPHVRGAYGLLGSGKLEYVAKPNLLKNGTGPRTFSRGIMARGISALGLGARAGIKGKPPIDTIIKGGVIYSDHVPRYDSTGQNGQYGNDHPSSRGRTIF